jgi:hypothetical protein
VGDTPGFGMDFGAEITGENGNTTMRSWATLQQFSPLTPTYSVAVACWLTWWGNSSCCSKRGERGGGLTAAQVAARHRGLFENRSQNRHLWRRGEHRSCRDGNIFQNLLNNLQKRLLVQTYRNK